MSFAAWTATRQAGHATSIGAGPVVQAFGEPRPDDHERTAKVAGRALREIRIPILIADSADFEAAWRIAQAFGDQQGIHEAFAFDAHCLLYRFGPARRPSAGDQLGAGYPSARSRVLPCRGGRSSRIPRNLTARGDDVYHDERRQPNVGVVRHVAMGASIEVSFL